ncbi:MAG: bifunctional alpha/beta hydrolase/OsmC family protein [Natronospirillum sp.]|uniref:bifunctional alpha/beta hydrolase/OsmC family protein n=1 Tax=Natronospirillum sp. TaxID=2812955 RepID=UPI0025E1352D|nr:bifunctional alpha/beta hydrolase/OsmC family protein [Natronospirillum sp.]MCH8551248.1 bifunctional alpha/beta hydrolase/OsmC family protein [Natronospirillum sp.]
MSAQRQKLTFDNAQGHTLAGLLELPAGPVLGYALFAHCFTCGKDIRAASRIARALAGQGIATLRFDFTGLGNSDGDFANTNFSSNVEDLVAAAEYLKTHHQAPALLIGHSLGGAAVLAAAGQVPSAKAVVTIGAPSEPDHVAHLFEGDRDEIEQDGEANVCLAGRPFRIRKQFLEDIEAHNLAEHIRKLRRPLLVFHAPMDETVSINEAAVIYQHALHPKSFVSLDDADHLVTRDADAAYIADTLVAWVKRYLEVDNEGDDRPSVQKGHVMVTEQDKAFTRLVYADQHHWLADEPTAMGGKNLGPDPYEHLLAALGTCTSMTIRMYANHKKWPVEDIQVSLTHDREHCADCAASGLPTDSKGKIDIIRRTVHIDAPELDEEQHQRLLEIADRCPVHKTLTNTIRIETVAGD